jgi:CubicO group peptidase (beta-lactamase class C family)
MASIARATALILGLLLWPLSATAGPDRDCPAVAVIGDGWPIATPQERGFDAGSLCAIGPHLAALDKANAHGVVVARAGALVYEAYFAGDDQRWPQKHWKEPLVSTGHDARTKHDIQSISKSVTALLVGAAIERGQLKSVDASVLSVLTNYADLATPERERIRVRDLLTMTSGLRWPQRPYLGMSRQMEAAADPVRFVLEQPMVARPGIVWRYNNGSAEVAGAVVKKAVGKPLDRFAREALFEPLAINDWEWGTMANGDPGASWGLRLRLRDLAKIGQLVLDRGTWQGRRVLPARWIEVMTAPQVVRPKTTYGFLWWLDHERVGDTEVETVAGYGWGGQRVEIVPRLGLVVAVNAGVYDFDGRGEQNLAADAALQMVLKAVNPR